MTPGEMLSEALDGTQAILTEVEKKHDGSDKLRWLQAQLRNIEQQLQHMLSEVDTGVSLSNLGFFGEDDFAETLDDLNVEITNLKGLIQTCISMER